MLTMIVKHPKHLKTLEGIAVDVIIIIIIID